MKVIGIGFNKTGTTSLTAALNLLGYNCCHNPRWWRMRRFLLGDCLGHDACCDYPAWECWQQLAALYTEARFILTTRNTDDWLRSRRAHVARAVARGRTRGWVEVDAEADRVMYERHNNDVRSYFATASNLLELPLCDGSGWEPLCQFLDKPIPPLPFPHRNATNYGRLKADGVFGE